MAVVDLEGSIPTTGAVAGPLGVRVNLEGGVSGAVVAASGGLASVVGPYGTARFGEAVFGDDTIIPVSLDLEGTVGGQSVFSADLHLDVALAGDIAVTATASASGSAQRDLAGDISGSGAFTGTHSQVINLSAELTAAAAFGGETALSVPLVGAVSASGAVSGTALFIRPSSKLIAAVSVQSATATVSVSRITATVSVIPEIKYALAA